MMKAKKWLKILNWFRIQTNAGLGRCKNHIVRISNGDSSVKSNMDNDCQNAELRQTADMDYYDVEKRFHESSQSVQAVSSQVEELSPSKEKTL